MNSSREVKRKILGGFIFTTSGMGVMRIGFPQAEYSKNLFWELDINHPSSLAVGWYIHPYRICIAAVHGMVWGL
jgi:hypothetical protein